MVQYHAPPVAIETVDIRSDNPHLPDATNRAIFVSYISDQPVIAKAVYARQPEVRLVATRANLAPAFTDGLNSDDPFSQWMNGFYIYAFIPYRHHGRMIAGLEDLIEGRLGRIGAVKIVGFHNHA